MSHPARTAAEPTKKADDTGGEVKVARPPIVMSGELPSVYVYPGILGQHPGATCNVHKAPMYSFAGGHLVCLHCVEGDLIRLPEPHLYHDQFKAMLAPDIWSQLVGPSKQAASCAKSTPQLSVARFVLLASHRLRVPLDIVMTSVLNGTINTLIPPPEVVAV
ncbi:MAG: hypothetical protein WCP91_03010 [Candidatus Berkelbacteria bacterium]